MTTSPTIRRTTARTRPAAALADTRRLPVPPRSVYAECTGYAGNQSEPPHEPARRGGQLRRLLAMLAFLAGGFLAEMAHPVQCELVNVNRVRLKPAKE